MTNHHYLFSDKRFFERFRVAGLFGAYLDTALLNLVMGLVGIFIPLYILGITGSILVVFIFYVFYHFVVTVSILPVAALAGKIGLDRTSLLGAVAKALFLLFLIFGKQNILFIAVAFVFWGLSTPLCYLPFHFTIENLDDGDKKFGKEVGLMGVVDRLSASLGPIAGGFVIKFLGFSWLYALSVMIALFSGMSLFLDKFERKGMVIDVKEIFNKLFEKKNSGVRRGLIGAGIESEIHSVVWPIFIFLAIGSYSKLGIISSTSLLVSLLVYWWAGRWVDGKGKGILKVGVAVNSLNLLLRPFLRSGLPIFLTDAVYLTGAILIWTPFNAAFYERGLGQRFDYIIVRELVLHFTGFVFSLILGILFYLQVPWWLIFSLGIFGLWLTTFIIKQESHEKENLRDAIPLTNS